MKLKPIFSLTLWALTLMVWGQQGPVTKKILSPTGPSKASGEKLTYLERIQANHRKDRYAFALKGNALGWITYEYGLGLEYKINPQWTVEGGVAAFGTAPYIPYIKRLFGLESLVGFHSNQPLQILVNAQAKVFLQNAAFQNGFYLGFYGQYKPYREEIGYYTADQQLIAFDTYRRHADLGLMTGWQTRAAETVLLDFYTGLAFRSTQRQGVKEILIATPNGGYITGLELLPKESANSPVLLAGARIGWLFKK